MATRAAAPRWVTGQSCQHRSSQSVARTCGRKAPVRHHQKGCLMVVCMSLAGNACMRGVGGGSEKNIGFGASMFKSAGDACALVCGCLSVGFRNPAYVAPSFFAASSRCLHKCMSFGMPLAAREYAPKMQHQHPPGATIVASVPCHRQSSIEMGGVQQSELNHQPPHSFHGHRLLWNAIIRGCACKRSSAF